jgi:hypothetical protein
VDALRLVGPLKKRKENSKRMQRLWSLLFQRQLQLVGVKCCDRGRDMCIATRWSCCVETGQIEQPAATTPVHALTRNSLVHALGRMEPYRGCNHAGRRITNHSLLISSHQTKRRCRFCRRSDLPLPCLVLWPTSSRESWIPDR